MKVLETGRARFPGSDVVAELQREHGRPPPRHHPRHPPRQDPPVRPGVGSSPIPALFPLPWYGGGQDEGRSPRPEPLTLLTPRRQPPLSIGGLSRPYKIKDLGSRSWAGLRPGKARAERRTCAGPPGPAHSSCGGGGFSSGRQPRRRAASVASGSNPRSPESSLRRSGPPPKDRGEAAGPLPSGRRRRGKRNGSPEHHGSSSTSRRSRNSRCRRVFSATSRRSAGSLRRP